MSQPVTISCNVCNIVFSKKLYLRRHVNRKHKGQADILLPKKHYEHRCKCGKQFTHYKNYKHHMKYAHNEQFDRKDDKEKAPSIYKCGLCSHRDENVKDLESHFKQAHEIELQSEIHKFATFDDFTVWKNQMEQSTQSFFAVAYKRKNTKNIVSKYLCHRSGRYIPSGNGLRCLKKKGSVKIDAYCPASVNVSVGINDGKCTVFYIATHIGHDVEVQHLSLTPPEREMIADKLKTNLSLDRILCDIKHSVGSNERLKLLTRKDLHNIRYGIKFDSDSEMKSGSNVPNNGLNTSSTDDSEQNFNKDTGTSGSDGSQINSSTSECDLIEETYLNPINFHLYYHKKLNTIDNNYPTLEPDDFVLILMTRAQKEILQNFSTDVICIDYVTDGNFQLTSLLLFSSVISTALPVALMISNRLDDEDLYEIFYTKINETLGLKIKPTVLMTDTSNKFYKTWNAVMSPPEYWLYNVWHIEDDWRKNLDKINNKNKQADIYEKLQKLTQETNKIQFRESLDTLLKCLLNDPDSEEFGVFLLNRYSNTEGKWASYRRANLNCDNSLQSIHESLKNLFRQENLQESLVAIVDFAMSDLLKHTNGEKLCRPKVSSPPPFESVKLEADKISNADYVRNCAQSHGFYESDHQEIIEGNNRKRKASVGFDLEAEKGKLIARFTRMIDRITSFEELEIVERMMDSIKTSLDSLRNKDAGDM